MRSHYRDVLLKLTLMLLAMFALLGNAYGTCADGDLIENQYLLRVARTPSSPGTQKVSDSVQDRLERFSSKFEVLSAQDNDQASSANFFSKLGASSAADVIFAEMSPEQATEIRRHPDLLSIEPNCLVHLRALNDDPGQAQSWGHDIVQLPAAWALVHDAPNVIVAVSDTGVDYKHEDLAENMWRNIAEENGVSGIDDDGNGCIDDIHGCDLADLDGDPTPGISKNSWHGTHVAGIIGAIGNNGKGLAGAAWKTQIMAVKGFNDLSDNSTIADLLKTVYYAANNGAKILNCSWGANHEPAAAEIEAFQYAISKGVLPIVAAGNEVVDVAGTSPAGIPDVLTVGSTNSSDRLSSFSNFGTLVDILAPGGDSASLGGVDEYIYSTMPMDQTVYAKKRGTSMASPLVAGVAALAMAANPNLTPSQIISVLMRSADTIDARPLGAQGSRKVYPRLNALKAVQYARDFSTNQYDCLPGENCSQNTLDVTTQFQGARMNPSCGSVAKLKSPSSGSNQTPLASFFLILAPLIMLLWKRFCYR